MENDLMTTLDAAVTNLDRRIMRDWDDGYGVDVDKALEFRKILTDSLRTIFPRA
jgi:hypothetical protein